MIYGHVVSVRKTFAKQIVFGALRFPVIERFVSCVKIPAAHFKSNVYVR